MKPGPALHSALWFLCGALATAVWMKWQQPKQESAAKEARRPQPPSMGKPKVGQLSEAELREALGPAFFTSESEALALMARELALTNPAVGWQAAGNIKNAWDRETFLAAFIRALATKDPKAAINYARSLPANQSQKTAITAACSGWASHDPLGAAQWAATELKGTQKTEACSTIAERWAEKDPASACQWAAALPEALTSEDALRAAMGSWAAKSGSSAAQWVDSLAPGATKSMARSELATSWGSADPQAAAAWVAQQANSPDVADLAESVAQSWADSDPAAATRWAAAMSGDARTQSLATAINTWTGLDPDGASAYALETNDPAIAKEVGGTRASFDGKGAYGWASTLPEPLKKSVMPEIFTNWAQNDTQSIRQWIEANQPSAETDQARIAAADYISDEEPINAMQLASGLTNPKDRLTHMSDIYEDWFHRNPADANAWFEKLPAETRSLLAPTVQRANEEEK